MIARPSGWRQSAWCRVALALAVLALASVALPLDPARWAWQRDALGTEPWRWLSGAVVHWSPAHAGANALGAAVLAFVGVRAALPPVAALAWVGAWPLGQAALWLQPDLHTVAGLSGLLHAGVAVLVLELVVHARGRDRWLGAAIGLGLLVKLGLEQPWGPALRLEPLWGSMPVAPWAHAAGAAAGALAWAGLRPFRKRVDSAGSAAPSAGP